MNRTCLSVFTTTIVLLSGFADAANRVEIQSTGVPALPCFNATVSISIENDVPLHSFSLPLEVRSVSGGAFWESKLDSVPSSGRLSTSLTGLRLMETSLVDYASPDRLVLYFEASAPGDCMPVGPLEVVTGLTFEVVPFSLGGSFIIDTLTYPPCYSPQLVSCNDLQPVTLDQFTPGTINVFFLPGGCNAFVSVDSDSVGAWAGAVLSNDADAADSEGDPMYFRLLSGPGSIDSLTGAWTWRTNPADSGSHQVAVQVYERNCPENVCFNPTTFEVTLRSLVPGDLNCDGVVNVLDVVMEIGHTFRAEPAPTPCWDL